jgi:hypothetical protein
MSFLGGMSKKWTNIYKTALYRFGRLYFVFTQNSIKIFNEFIMNPRRQVSVKVAQTIDKQVQEVIKSAIQLTFISHWSLVAPSG